jgi:hypothetical protein
MSIFPDRPFMVGFDGPEAFIPIRPGAPLPRSVAMMAEMMREYHHQHLATQAAERRRLVYRDFRRDIRRSTR